MFLLPHEDLSVPLSVPAPEFYSRLNASMISAHLRPLFRNGFVGSASDASVRVRWARKWVSNDLAPQFQGSVSADQKFLRGTFRQRGWVLGLVVLSVVLGFAAIAAGLVLGARTPINPRWAAAAVVALLAFAVLLPRLGWALASSDVERITEALRAAARGQSPRVEAR